MSQSHRRRARRAAEPALSPIQQRLRAIWRACWAPPDRRPPWAWADEHLQRLPYSPVPNFHSAHSPWIREPLEAATDPRVRMVLLQASIQSSKTTVAEVLLLYLIANQPGPTLWLDQTEDSAADQAESRLHVAFDNCPPVKALFHTNRHKRKNQTTHFANGMTLWVLSGGNKTNLQRRSIRWLIGDETWRWPAGHMAEAEARVTAFGWLGKCIFLSQGGEVGDDTDLRWQATDRREWTYACPHCGHRQPFRWSNVEWSKTAQQADGTWDYAEVHRTVSLRCEGCGEHFADNTRTRQQLNASGQFVPQNPHASPAYVGFHWNALCSMSWGQLAELYLRAKAALRAGDQTAMAQFYQKRLGQSWQTHFEQDFKAEVARSGYRLGQSWEREAAITSAGLVAPPFAPELARTPLRFLTVDVQQDHFFAVIRSWSVDGCSRLFWHQRLLLWDDIAALQERFGIFPKFVFIDSGYNPNEVYRHCADRRWTALRGDKRTHFVHHQPKGRSIVRFYSVAEAIAVGHTKRCFQHYFSNLNIKDILFRLRRNQDPAKGATWEVADDVEEDYLRQLDSEHRVLGKTGWMWQQIGHRPNHYWDCEAMQVVAACMLKIIGQEAVGPGSSAGLPQRPVSPEAEVAAAVDQFSERSV